MQTFLQSGAFEFHARHRKRNTYSSFNKFVCQLKSGLGLSGRDFLSLSLFYFCQGQQHFKTYFMT